MDYLPVNLDSYSKQILPKLHGWCEQEKAERMMRRILKVKPKVVVEIGVFAGRSLFAMGLAVKENGVGQVIGIEPWSIAPCQQGLDSDDPNHKWWSSLDHQAIERSYRKTESELGLGDTIRIINAPSDKARGALGDIEIDFLHIDGNHSEDVSCYDVENYLPLVRTGGEIWFDDVNWDSTRKAQEMLKSQCDEVYRSETYGIFKKRKAE